MNNFQRHKALTAFSHLRGGEKRGCEVFVGDHEYAELCTFLTSNKIVHNWNKPSRWKKKFPQGYIELKPVPFAQGGCYFDLQTHTVEKAPVYIFEKTAMVWKLARRLTAVRNIGEYAAQYQSGDLRALYELLPGRTEWPWTPTDDVLRREIAECLGDGALDFGLKELEDLVAAAEPGLFSRASRTT